MFHHIAQQWGFSHKVSTPHYPQSNGKVEATVKSMKKIIRTSWNGRSLSHDKFCQALLQYRITPSHRDGLSPHRSSTDTLCKTSYHAAHGRSFAKEWQLKAKSAEQQASNTFLASEKYYNQHAHTLLDIQVESNVAIHNTRTKLWDIYGIVTHITPHRCYYVKTPSGRVLIRNRRFLRHRVPTSIPLSTLHQLTSQQSPAPEQQPVPRRSTEFRHPPKGLVKNPNWH